jgi:hypothetical protein
MSLADRQTFHGQVNEVAYDKEAVFLTAATSLTIRQRVVHATASTTYPSWTLTLPSVAEAAGLTFSIVSSIANSQAVTVADAGDDANFSNLTLDTDDDAALLYSDGRRWWVVVSDIA